MGTASPTKHTLRSVGIVGGVASPTKHTSRSVGIVGGGGLLTAVLGIYIVEVSSMRRERLLLWPVDQTTLDVINEMDRYVYQKQDREVT